MKKPLNTQHRRLSDYSQVHSTGLARLKSSWDMVALLPAAAISYVAMLEVTNSPLQSIFMAATSVTTGYGAARFARNCVLRLNLKDVENHCLNTKPSTERRLEAKQESNQTLLSKERKLFLSHVLLEAAIVKSLLIGIAVVVPSETFKTTIACSLIPYATKYITDTFCLVPLLFNFWTIDEAPPAPAEEAHPELLEKLLEKVRHAFDSPTPISSPSHMLEHAPE